MSRLLRQRGVRCSLLLADRISGGGGINWTTRPVSTHATMRDDDGQSVVVHEIDRVWWRRLTGTPALPIGLTSDATKLVANDCQAALLGALMTAFRGMWISPPEATRLAQNKLVQLHEAQAAGLRIPRTLVSQDPEQVRAFHEELGINPGVIVKPVHGAQDVPIMTGLVDRQMLTE